MAAYPIYHKLPCKWCKVLVYAMSDEHAICADCNDLYGKLQNARNRNIATAMLKDITRQENNDETRSTCSNV